MNKINKTRRQYIGLVCAILAYYFVHEGTHLIYALLTGVFKKIHFVGFGIQIDVYAEKLTKTQLGIFCIIGSIATILTSYVLVLLSDKITKASSKIFKASFYYITLAMLFLDPIYLSFLYKFFGGGDMNGISLLIPEFVAQCIYGLLLLFNLFLFIKVVLPKYKIAFSKN